MKMVIFLTRNQLNSYYIQIDPLFYSVYLVKFIISRATRPRRAARFGPRWPTPQSIQAPLLLAYHGRIIEFYLTQSARMQINR